MDLTTEQITTLESGDAVELTIGGRKYVVLGRDLYERLKQAMLPENGDGSPRETYPAVLKAWDKDEEDPEQYLEYLQDP